MRVCMRAPPKTATMPLTSERRGDGSMVLARRAQNQPLCFGSKELFTEKRGAAPLLEGPKWIIISSNQGERKPLSQFPSRAFCRVACSPAPVSAVHPTRTPPAPAQTTNTPTPQAHVPPP